MTGSVTPLERSLEPGAARATPLDALRLAQETLLAGETLDMGALAAQLGLSRATLYRWVGSKERLLGEVLWSLAADAMDAAVDDARGSGPDFVAEVIERYMNAALGFEPLWRFVARDPEYALKVIASRHSPMQRRSIAAVHRVLEQQASAGAIEPALALDSLAYLIVRIVESFLYTDVITGGEPDVGAARDAVRALLSAPRA
ncbi:MAG: TetR/AcrR family transcriptional regulator [Actinobacteria bacterium]|nr:MAG: TetR/AcrR family transcriptional regulator [Actinomycetota bacterium]